MAAVLFVALSNVRPSEASLSRNAVMESAQSEFVRGTPQPVDCSRLFPFTSSFHPIAYSRPPSYSHLHNDFLKTNPFEGTKSGLGPFLSRLPRTAGTESLDMCQASLR